MDGGVVAARAHDRWEHTFVHQLHDLLRAIADGTPASPDFADGLALQRTLAAVLAAARSGATVRVD